MRIDIHNHTVLCNHASGTTEEYIQKAIELGIEVYGFSEHSPMNNFEDGYRLTLDKKEFYENDILKLQKKYKEKIKILLGYEVDYIDGDFLLNEILTAEVDYLIGSVHYLDTWGFDNPDFIKEYDNKNIDTIWKDYFKAVENMAKTNYFQIVGHLDLIKVFKFLPITDIADIVKDALTAIKKANMAIEINTAGLRKPINEIYPSRSLLSLAYDMNIPITFSSDAHNVEQIGFKYNDAIIFAKDVGYTKCCYFENKKMIEINF